VKRFSFWRWHKKPVRVFHHGVKYFFGRSLEILNALHCGPVSVSMMRAIAATDADVICASTVDYLFADYPLWRKFIKNKKPFVLYGGIHLHNAIIPRRYLKRIAAADKYIANTAFEKDTLIETGINPDKITIVGTATDMIAYADKIEHEDELRKKYDFCRG